MAESAVSIAAIGVGRLGMLHATNLAQRVPGADLRVVVDADETAARRGADLCGVPFTTDVQTVLEDPSILAVEICTATSTHADLIVAAAEAGKHIFCEKPIALTLEDTDRALRAVNDAGVLLQIGFMRRYDPTYREAKRLIAEGHIGRPLTFRSSSLDGGISSSREFLASNGGIFLDVAIHDFDLARWLMDDEIVEVYATGAVLVHQVLQEFSDVDNAVATLRFAGGGIGLLQASHTAVYGYDIATEVIGERGAIRTDALRQHDLWLYGTDQRVSYATVPDFHRRFADAYYAEMVDFVSCVQAARSPAMRGADARAALVIALAARQSLLEGRPIQI